MCLEHLLNLELIKSEQPHRIIGHGPLSGVVKTLHLFFCVGGPRPIVLEAALGQRVWGARRNMRGSTDTRAATPWPPPEQGPLCRKDAQNMRRAAQFLMLMVLGSDYCAYFDAFGRG